MKDLHCTKNWSFPLSISLVNVTKSTVSWGYTVKFKHDRSFGQMEENPVLCENWVGEKPTVVSGKVFLELRKKNKKEYALSNECSFEDNWSMLIL